MAAAAGIERRRYERIERGAEPTISEAVAICKVLDKNIAWLTGGTDNELKGGDLEAAKLYQELPSEWRSVCNDTIRNIHRAWTNTKIISKR